MDLSFSDEQEQLRRSVRGFLDRSNTFAVRTKSSRSESGFNAELWKSFADQLCLLGAAVTENAGGIGLGPVELMVIMEEFGRNLVIEPFRDAAVIAPLILQRTSSASDLLDAITTGNCITSIGWFEPGTANVREQFSTIASRHGDEWEIKGAKSVVPGAPWATHFLLPAQIEDRMGIFLVDSNSPDLEIAAYPTIDGRRAGELECRGVRVPSDRLVIQGDDARLVWNEALDMAIVMNGAEAIGVLGKLLDLTISYTKQRVQFGKPISEFQSLQHRMVDMFMKVELAISAVYRAVTSLHLEPEVRTQAASAMKVSVNEACRFVGQNAIQLHGGMGMTDEMEVSHYFRRATALEIEFGTSDFHLDRFARSTCN